MKKISALIFIMMLLAACGAESDDSTDRAAAAVESYLQAKVDGDTDGISDLICSDLESTIEREAASFASVEATLEDMNCSSDGDVVTCDGQIVALYGTENREFPLTSYRVVQEDGEWRWCGEGN